MSMQMMDVSERFDNVLDFEFIEELITEFKTDIRKKGVSSVIEKVELSRRNNKEDFPSWVVEVFYKCIFISVEELYTIAGHTLTVNHGHDPFGSFIRATCSSGAFAEWHVDSDYNIFEDWDSWERDVQS
ncbi:hypothetical protein BSK66_25925 [Paenibacillus odorifer]|uniref:Uncharacterized protein n=1 Tax=Paenibacillus odorifer TaxID=189426 RepID=A0A1R0X1E9_9BACL|nr:MULTISPECIES: hypothetical protein [Paenibacillus]ETT61876.1 hypothetical protein C171_11541 [Paenibacillus sp. FSL H8-237]OMD26540.1 hypothetical protein BJP51_26780 [Paenibacillus odorifer]OME49959.1 hypothetical protein BSK66_25925 [Paenibacillus odorifer]